MTFGNFTGIGWSWDDFVAEVFAPEHQIEFTYWIENEMTILLKNIG